ncbi:MAG: exonuclease SbcCD subunit D [Gemmataceae bacterium]
MKILHTADWHLGDRLGRIDRTEDLRRAVERVAAYCQSEAVDVLLVAGDLFSELARPDSLREAIRHLQQTFGSFLARGGTILALTGNHDNENFCQTLWHAMSLASPAGSGAATGRLHLATDPTLLRLPDRASGFDVQFLLMPFPTPGRYLDEPAARYASLDEKNRQLIAAFSKKLRALRDGPGFDKDLPTVLSAHLSVTGGEVSPLFRLSEPEDLVLPGEEISADFAYVALGHIHRPQFLGGQENVRYCGSIERLDLGEKNDQKSVAVFDIGPAGLRGDISLLPLESTPVYEVDIVSPKDQLPALAERFPDSQRDLVNLHITYTAGVDNLDEVLRELENVFPRWYSRDWKETSTLGPALTTAEADRGKTFAETVRDYLGGELTNHAEDERAAVLQRAEELLQEM